MPSEIYRISWRAKQQLGDIADYLDQYSQSAAIAVLDRLLETFQFLAFNPMSGEARNDLHTGIRAFVPRKPADKYVILYYPLDNGIEVSDVLHSSRNWESLISRRKR